MCPPLRGMGKVGCRCDRGFPQGGGEDSGLAAYGTRYTVRPLLEGLCCIACGMASLARSGPGGATCRSRQGWVNLTACRTPATRNPKPLQLLRLFVAKLKVLSDLPKALIN